MEQNKNLNSDEIVGQINLKNDSEEKGHFLAVAAVLGISGISAVIAGVVTSHVAKKKNEELLRELGKTRVPQVLPESPYSLAFRALAWGTVWAVGGCSLIAFGVWKWFGFKDLEDLRTRMRSHIKKTTDEKTEFKNFSEFLTYLNETSNAEKKRKGS